tara:strand:- start:659 stop:1021 length:363 start_codon:yes stop_codon:yes gene_type:complete
MKKNQLAWIIIIAVTAVAILIYKRFYNQFVAQQITPTTENDWLNKSFAVKSPFGKIVISGQELTAGIGDTIIQDVNYEIGKRSYADKLEVYMIHKNESDPVVLSTITYTYDVQSIFPQIS